jgi:VWFA-related protein
MRISSVLSAILLIGTCVAQQTVPDSNVVIRSSTREVLLEVVVRDAHGKLVRKIDPEQVSVYEDGVRQEILSFRLVQGSEVRAQDEKQVAEQAAEQAMIKPAVVASAVVAPPASVSTPRPPFNPLRTVNVVCLILNDLTTDTRAFAFEAAKKFVDKELRPDTFIGVFSLDATGLRPVFPFSNNREHLVKAVELASINQLPALAQSTGAMLNGLLLTGAALNGLNGPLTPGGAPAAGNADGSSPADPLGTRGDMGVAVQAGLREIDALQKLVRQLSPLPFQKTVMMMSTGLTRPPDQLEYWNSLIKSANKAGVTFYAMDVNSLAPCQGSSSPDCIVSTPSSAAVSMLQKSASLSAGQSSVGAGAGQATPRAGGGVNIGASGAAQLMESMHQTDYLRFGVLSSNVQEALRELAESTGGFLIANTNNTDRLARVMEDVDTHYEISYKPASEIEDGHFRKIEVKLAKPELRVQTRSGYFAVPDNGGDPLTPAEMAGLRALDTKPAPRAFDFQSKAFRFRSSNAGSQYAIAFEVPISNLTATPEPAEKKQRFHASLLALVKDSRGEIVDRVSKDVSSEVLDQHVAQLRAENMTYEHGVNLPPGHYTIETVVVDQEGNRASAQSLQIDNREQPGLGLSDIALVHRVQDLQRPPDASDPFEIPGKRALPIVSTALPAGSEPSVYFVVYPDRNSRDFPQLRAQFLMNGHVLATQNSALPAPDGSGAIPMAIRAVSKPGDYEVRITIEQGRASVQRNLKYSIAAK